MTRKVLVTGGSGFIGTHVIETLLAMGVEVVNLDIRPPHLEYRSRQWLHCDVKDLSTLVHIMSETRPTHILHLAARANVEGETINEFEDNIEGTRNVCQAIAKCSSVTKFIHTSTQFVVKPGIYPESDFFFDPYTAYGESKALTEKIVRRANLANTTWCIIRPTNIWGPYHFGHLNGIWKYINAGLYFHPGSGAIAKHYGYVRNAADQIIHFLFSAPNKNIHARVFYISDPPIDSYSWVNAFSRALRGREVRRIPKSVMKGAARLGDMLRAIGVRAPMYGGRYFRLTQEERLPIERTHKICGAPRFTLEEGVAETVEWIRNLWQQ